MTTRLVCHQLSDTLHTCNSIVQLLIPACSGNVGGADNLAPAHYDDYVDYLTEVVQHHQDELNITFSTVEPFNEPSSKVWKQGNVQEGCHYDASTQRTILQACHPMPCVHAVAFSVFC